MVRSEESGDQTGAMAGTREDNERRQAETSLLYSLERGGRGELGSVRSIVLGRVGDSLQAV
jgi:hypothetical protein